MVFRLVNIVYQNQTHWQHLYSRKITKSQTVIHELNVCCVHTVVVTVDTHRYLGRKFVRKYKDTMNIGCRVGNSHVKLFNLRIELHSV